MQIEWYAKKGLAWLVTVIETPVEDNGTIQIKQDYYISLLDSQYKQDATATGAILEAVLKLHKKNNANVTEYFLRSDQAGCFKTKDMIIPLWSLNQDNELDDAKIKSYIYSEAGSGKSQCDQVKFGAFFAFLFLFISQF